MNAPDRHLQPVPFGEQPSPQQRITRRDVGKLLTTKDQIYEVSADVQELLAYTDKNILFIARGKKAHHFVMGFISRLTRANVVFTESIVDYPELRGLYEAQSDIEIVETEDQAAQQQEILGYMKEAARMGASDVHIIPGRHPDPRNPDTLVNSGQIRYRLDGELTTAHDIPRTRAEAIIATIYQTMCDLQERVYKPHANQNARFLAEYARQAGLYVARVATGPTDDGQHCVIRLHHDNGHQIVPLDQMHYEPEQVEAIDIMRRRGKGLRLVSGPVNSGKTTLLANLMKMAIRDANGQISMQTLEDPVELPIPGAQQKPVPTTSEDEEVNESAWVEAMAHLLRTDPNVVMIGEVRKAPTIHALISIVLTGRPTWSTIHAGSAIQSLERLRDAKVDRTMVLDPTLIVGLINQSLVRTLCPNPNCKISWAQGKHTLPASLVARVEATCDVANVFLRNQKGCPHCSYKGIKGRRVCAETLIPTIGFMRAYDQGGVAGAREYWLGEMGGLTKTQHLIRLINRGLVDPATGEYDATVELDEDLIIYGKNINTIAKANT